MRRSLLLVLLLPAPLQAQLHLDLRVGIVDHAGHARDASDEEAPEFAPGAGRDVGLALGVDRGPWRLAIALRRETPDLVLLGTTTGIITRDALAAWQGAVEAGRRVLGEPRGPALHLLGGVALTRWSFPEYDDPARNRLAALLAAEGSLPFTARIDGTLRIEAAMGASLFDADELPEGYEARGARRFALTLGLRWHR